MIPFNRVFILMVMSLYQIKSEKEVSYGAVSFSHSPNVKLIKLLNINHLEGKVKLGDTSRQRRTPDRGCSGSCEAKKIPCCYCDALCNTFNDCCLEYYEAADTLSTRQIENEITCELPNVRNGEYNLQLPFGVYMVKTCLMKYQGSMLAEKCSKSNLSDILEIVPVTNKIGLSFSNIFCAICNDVLDASFWDIGIYPSDATLKQEIKDPSKAFQNFDKTIKIPAPMHPVKPRVCIRSSLKGNYTVISDLCYKYQQPVLFNKLVFRNIHCIHKELIEECYSLSSPPNNRCQRMCIEGKDVDLHKYLFQRIAKRMLMIKFGRHVHVEYDSKRCRPEELLAESKVKCVRLGCTEKIKGECNRYKIFYTKYLINFRWYISDTFPKDVSEDMTLKRYIHFILYVLSYNRVSLTHPYLRVVFCSNNTCDGRMIAGAFSSENIISIEEAEKLQGWISKLQLSYTETNIYNVQTPILERMFEAGKNLTDAYLLMYPNVYSNRVRLMQDISVYYQALARYHTPFLSFKDRCRHIHLSLSLNESTNNIDKYKPIEFYCVNASTDRRPKALSVLLLSLSYFVAILITTEF